MSILLAVYRLFLEKEKMHHFNRVYLIAAILLSLVVPLLPTGITSFYTGNQLIEQNIALGDVEFIQASSSEIEQSYVDVESIIASLYLLIFIVLMIKFSRNIIQLTNSVSGKEKRVYHGAKIILLDHCVSPFTFLDYIFLDKRDFENKNIDIQLIDHELAHAKQGHSFDIIFIEFLITIFWFNPILRWYKTSMQLNHEFLADEAVINKYDTVKSYQYLLLDTIQKNNKISLASNINFQLTQKRLKMMTKKSSSLRKKMLIFSMIPIILGILLAFGNPVIIPNEAEHYSTEFQGDPKTEKDRYFEHAVVHYVTMDGKTKVISYKSMSDEMKAKIPPPPPLPPAPPGSKREEKELKPLPKGTVVYLKDDGSVSIGNGKNGNMDLLPPPPPPPHVSMKEPKEPKAPKALKAPKAPKVPKTPKAMKTQKVRKAPQPPKPPKPGRAVEPDSPAAPAIPPPPPPPTTLKELYEEGATFYLDGKLASKKQTQEILKLDMDDIATIDVRLNDGKKSVYVVKK